MRGEHLFFLWVVGVECQLVWKVGEEKSPLVDSVMAVAERFFTGRTVAFFYERDNRKDVLLEEILFRLHKNWTVYLPSKSQQLDGEVYFYDGGIHTYLKCPVIVPIRDTDYASQIQTVLYSTWNMDYSDEDEPKTRYLIVVDGEISKTQALEGMSTMFKKGDVDAVIMGLENGMVTAYTLYPFGINLTKCPENGLSLTTLIQFNKTYDFKTTFFPNKVPNIFNGCKFPVSTVQYPPFTFYNKQNKMDGIDYWMMSYVTKHLNATMNVTYYDQAQGWMWSDKTTGVARGSMIDVRDGSTWATMSGVTNNLMHYRVLYIKLPYVYPRLVWYFPNPRPVETWKLVYLSFSFDLWIGFIAILVICPIFVTILANLSKKETIFSNFGKSFFAHYGIAFGNSTGQAPISGILRLVFTTWFFYTIHMNNAYTASLTCLMTGGTMEPKVKTIDDIIEREMPTKLMLYLLYAVSGLMDTKLDKVFERKVLLSNYTAALEEIVAYRNACLLDNDLFIDHLIKQNKFQIYMAPVVLFSVPMGIMMKRNHFMFERVNAIIFRLMQAGFNFKLVKDYTEIPGSKDTYTWSGITIKDLAGPFFILIIGNFASLLVFLTEMASTIKWKRLGKKDDMQTFTIKKSLFN